MRNAKSGSAAGFTLVELLVVVVIILIVSAMAIPGILRAADNVRLRSTASNLSGLMQSARQMAIRDNRFYTCRPAVINNANVSFIDSLPANIGGNNGLYEGPNPGGATLADQQGEKVVQVPDTIQFEIAGANPFFPNALVGPTFAPQPVTTMPSFNARGLPCVVAGAQCLNTTGFRYFLRMNGMGGTRWAAITVTPAGRIRVWTWSGTQWS